jgi:hypothetical protein
LLPINKLDQFHRINNVSLFNAQASAIKHRIIIIFLMYWTNHKTYACILVANQQSWVNRKVKIVFVLGYRICRANKSVCPSNTAVVFSNAAWNTLTYQRIYCYCYCYCYFILFILFYFILFYFILFYFILFYFIYFILLKFILFYFILFYFTFILLHFYFILFCFVLFHSLNTIWLMAAMQTAEERMTDVTNRTWAKSFIL